MKYFTVFWQKINISIQIALEINIYTQSKAEINKLFPILNCIFEQSFKPLIQKNIKFNVKHLLSNRKLSIYFLFCGEAGVSPPGT